MSTASSRVERNASTRSWGEIAYKSHRVGEQRFFPRGKLEPTHGGVKRGEKPILDEHSRAGEGVEQARLARVGVADDRRGGDLGGDGPCAGLPAPLPDPWLALELRDARQYATPVGLELRLTRAAGPDPAAETAHFDTLPPQTREAIPIHRQFHLRPSCPAGGVEGEYVEDERHPVDDVDLEDLLEVALLHRAEFAVDHDEIDVERFADPGQLGGLALADIGRRVGVSAALHRTLHRVRAGGVDQPFHLVERRFHLVGVAVGRDQRDQQGALPSDGDVCDCGCEPAAASGDVAIGHE